MLKTLLFILPATFLLSACSVYQSEGREFLEQQGIDFVARGESLLEEKACQQNTGPSNETQKDWPLPEDLQSEGYKAFLQIEESQVLFHMSHKDHTSPVSTFCRQQYPSLKDFIDDEPMTVYGSAYAIDKIRSKHQNIPTQD